MTIVHSVRAGFALALLPLACTSHHVTVDPIEVKPIQVTVDVNVRVQRELEEFFQFEDEVDPDKAAKESAVKAPSEVGTAQPAKREERIGMIVETGTLLGTRLETILPLASIALCSAPVGAPDGAQVTARDAAQDDAKKREELQQRMKTRYPSLDGLRDAGKVGETYQGLAAAVKPEHEKEKVDPSDAKSQTIGELLRAENSDRRALYELLAKELKTTAEEVGKQNGIRNLKKAEPNHWFQLKTSLWAQRKDIKEEGG